MEIEVVEATKELVEKMKGKIRKADHQESLASHGVDADQGIQIAMSTSKLTWIALLKGEPAMIFGVGKLSLFSSEATPWLMGTRLMGKLKIRMIKDFKPYIKKMFELADVLENYVDERNKVSQKWLRFMGFKMDEPKPYGFQKKPFRRFSMKKEDFLCACHS